MKQTRIKQLPLGFLIINAAPIYIVCLLITAVYSQDIPIEKRLTEKELSRPEVATIAGRLTQLRRNEARFGPKHPSTKSVKNQILSLENQLKEMTGQVYQNAPPISPVNPPNSAKRSEDVKSTDSSPVPIVFKPSEWEFEPWSRWPACVDDLINETERKTDYQEAYPQLGLPDLSAVGPMPGLGLMWGVQYDSVEDHSYIFQWFDHPGSNRRELLFDIPGQVHCLYYPSTFDNTGRLWVIRQIKRPDSKGDPRRSDWQQVEILSCPSDQMPPYAVDSKSTKKIGDLRIPSHSSKDFLTSQQKGLYIKGEVEFTPQGNIPLRMHSLGSDLWVLDQEHRDFGPGNHTDKSRVQSVSILSQPLEKSIGVDSLGRRMIVDPFGRILKKSDSSIRSTRDDAWPPKHLSSLGWYRSLVDGDMIDSFVRFIPENEASNPLPPGFLSECWVSTPKSFQMELAYQDPPFPDGTIVVQTISRNLEAPLETEPRNRKIETRVLVYADVKWFAYRYLWDAEESDGVLDETLDQEIEMPTSAHTDEPNKQLNSNNCFGCHQKGPIGLTREKWEQVRSEVLTAKPNNERDGSSSMIGWPSQRIGPLTKESPLEWSPILIDRKPDSPARNFPEEVLGNQQVAEEIDWNWFKASLLQENIEPWYKASFRPSGFFCTELDEKWTPRPNPSATLVSQTRLIYTMAIGYSVSKDPKLLDATKKGIQFLLQKFKDTKHGGYYYQVSDQGIIMDRSKDGYGHAFVIYALATAAKVSGERAYAMEALECWKLLRSRMMESEGGLLWKASEDFSKPNRRSQNPNIYLFEGLLELYDATKDLGIYRDAKRLLDFVVDHLRHESGVIPEDYQADWNSPVMVEDRPYIQMGHQVQWAFLISRAVEIGFPRRYLNIGQELMDYAMQHGFDKDTGGLHDIPNRGKDAWQQAELLRALLRYYAMHGRSEYAEAILKTQELIKEDFIDKQYGGWVESEKKEKGNHWKAASHEVAMYLEGMRVLDSMQAKNIEETR